MNITSNACAVRTDANEVFRVRLRTVANIFKRSWLLLAIGVNNVKRNELFKDWGYREFNEYLKAELGLSTRSFYELRQALNFIEISKPQLKVYAEAYLRDETEFDSYIPPLKSVLLLDRMRKVTEPEKFKDLVENVFKGQIDFPSLRAQKEKDATQRLVRLVKEIGDIVSTRFLASDSEKSIFPDEVKKTIKRLYELTHIGDLS